jgi:hypothetical protein
MTDADGYPYQIQEANPSDLNLSTFIINYFLKGQKFII